MGLGIRIEGDGDGAGDAMVSDPVEGRADGTVEQAGAGTENASEEEAFAERRLVRDQLERYSFGERLP